jgi:hypothetical protein
MSLGESTGGKQWPVDSGQCQWPVVSGQWSVNAQSSVAKATTMLTGHQLLTPDPCFYLFPLVGLKCMSKE